MKMLKRYIKTSYPRGSGNREVETKMGKHINLKLVFLPLLFGILLVGIIGLAQAALTFNVSDNSNMSGNYGLYNVGVASSVMGSIVNCTWNVWTTSTGTEQNNTATNEHGTTFNTTGDERKNANQTSINTIVKTKTGYMGLPDAENYNIKATCWNATAETAAKRSETVTVTGMYVDNWKPVAPSALYPKSTTITDYRNRTMNFYGTVNETDTTSCTLEFNTSGDSGFSTPGLLSYGMAYGADKCSYNFTTEFARFGKYSWTVKASDGRTTTIGPYYTITMEREGGTTAGGKWYALTGDTTGLVGTGGETISPTTTPEKNNKGLLLLILLIISVYYLSKKNKKK